MQLNLHRTNWTELAPPRFFPSLPPSSPVPLCLFASVLLLLHSSFLPSLPLLVVIVVHYYCYILSLPLYHHYYYSPPFSSITPSLPLPPARCWMNALLLPPHFPWLPSLAEPGSSFLHYCSVVAAAAGDRNRASPAVRWHPALVRLFVCSLVAVVVPPPPGHDLDDRVLLRMFPPCGARTDM